MMCVDNITVEDFKAIFTRDFPYLPVWQYGKTYLKGDIVYTENFYQSKIDGNTDEPPTTNWTLHNDNIFNYITDEDISRAFVEAKINFNPQLFPNCETMRLVFCYLAAHYLVIDLNNAQNPLALGFMGFTQSKHVGSVSESYGIPQWMMSNSKLSLYAQTGYGRKYLSLIQPYLTGNIIYTAGRINFG